MERERTNEDIRDMTYERLIFKDSFITSVEYEDLCRNLKTKLNNNFFKGYIDKDETLLFYYPNFINASFVIRLPMTQIKFSRPINNKEQLKIKFKIVDFILILFGIACLTIWSAFIFNYAEPEIGGARLMIPTIATVFAYFFLQIMYAIEIDKFKRDLETIKKEISQTRANTGFV